MSDTDDDRRATADSAVPDAAAEFAAVSSEVTHEGVMSTIRIDRVAMPDGEVATREVAQRPDAVAVVPLTDDGAVVLVRQYRHPVGGYELEIPAGLLDVEGETVEEAAQRELAEEVGMHAGQLRRLTRFWNSAGWSDEATTVFLGTGLRSTTPDDGFVAEAEEADMEVLHVPLRDALDAVREGRITDAKTVIGLLLTDDGRHQRGRPAP
ncbi:MAG: NUDIX hydrolase [Actinobacteria bacterium]|nr:NUDIX hydrolase [Actinomycetota bacterium]